MDCELCKSEHRIKSLEEDRDRNSNQHREFYSKFEEVNIKNATFEEKFNRIMATLDEIKRDLNELKCKPTKRWDSVVAAIISATVVIIVSYAFNGGIQ